MLASRFFIGTMVGTLQAKCSLFLEKKKLIKKSSEREYLVNIPRWRVWENSHAFVRTARWWEKHNAHDSWFNLSILIRSLCETGHICSYGFIKSANFILIVMLFFSRFFLLFSYFFLITYILLTYSFAFWWIYICILQFCNMHIATVHGVCKLGVKLICIFHKTEREHLENNLTVSNNRNSNKTS